jgi:hypothetical protein
MPLLGVGDVLLPGQVLGNACFYASRSGADDASANCQPFFLALTEGGRLQLRPGRDPAAKARPRWTARRRLSMDWVGRLLKLESRRRYMLTLTENGTLELLTDQGEVRWRSVKPGHDGQEGAYAAMVTAEGRLVVKLGDLLHWRSP